MVDEKSRIVDWEIALVIGKGHSGALVTIVERKTSFTVSTRVNDKSAETVTAAAIALLTPYISSVLTITADNGINSVGVVISITSVVYKQRLNITETTNKFCQ